MPIYAVLIITDAEVEADDPQTAETFARNEMAATIGQRGLYGPRNILDVKAYYTVGEGIVEDRT